MCLDNFHWEGGVQKKVANYIFGVQLYNHMSLQNQFDKVQKSICAGKDSLPSPSCAKFSCWGVDI